MKVSLFTETLKRFFLILLLLSAGFNNSSGTECILIGKDKQLQKLKDIAVWSSSLENARIENFSEMYELKVGTFDKVPQDLYQRIKKYFPESTLLRDCVIDYSNWIVKNEEINLYRMGYLKDIVIKGNNPYFHMFIPVFNSFFAGKVVFQLTISPIAKPDSIITVTLNDVPISTFKLRDVGYSPTITVPLKGIENYQFVKVAVSATLKKGDNICEDINAKNLFMKIDVKRSTLYVMRYTNTSNIKDFFEDYTKDFYIYPVMNDEILKLSYYIPASIRWLKASIRPYIPSKPFSKLILFSENGSFTEDIGNGSIQILKINKPEIISETIIPTLLTESVLSGYVLERNEKLTYSNGITFRQLGFGTTTNSGVGVISFLVPINTAMIGGRPNKFYLKLFLSHSAIEEEDRVTLEILLNDFLIASYKLSGEETKRKGFFVEFPSNVLDAGINQLLIRVRYYPASKKCVGAVPKLTVTVFGDSYLYWNTLLRDVESVKEFLNLVNGNVAIIVEDASFKPYVAHLLTTIARLNPAIRKISILKSLSGLSKEKYDYAILFLKSSSAEELTGKIEVPFKIKQGSFSVFNPITYQTLFQLEPGDSIGVMETVVLPSGTPALLISYVGNSDVIEGLEQFNQENVSYLSGNVVLFSNKDFSTLEIGKKFKVKYACERDLIYYWNTYKSVLLIILIALIALFISFVRRNLVKTERKEP
jgi:hypothetical protein